MENYERKLMHFATLLMFACLNDVDHCTPPIEIPLRLQLTEISQFRDILRFIQELNTNAIRYPGQLSRQIFQYIGRFLNIGRVAE